MKNPKHGEFKELFTGRRNVLTVMMVFIGGYFIAYPLVNITIHELGNAATIAIGFVALILGDYILDAFHKSK